MKDLSVPISFYYHSSGIKVNDLSSSVGLGWTLNAGGLVSSSINGLTDLGPNGWPNSRLAIPQKTRPYVPFQTSWADDLNWEYDSQVYLMMEAANDVFDTQPDLFYYSFPGANGRFFFNDEKEVCTIPFSKKNILIDESRAVIVDESGNRYEYNNIESLTTSFIDYGRPEGSPISENFSLYLSKITTPYGEVVNFVYEAESYSFKNQRLETRFSFKFTAPGCMENRPFPYYSESTTHVNRPRLIEINSNRGHRVNFTYGNVRNDLLGSKMLSQVKVIDGYGNDIKVDLFHSYFGDQSSSDPDGIRLRLDSVKTNGASIYKFQYNQNSGMPHRRSYSQDHWGYFNGSLNSTLLPMDDYFGFNLGANRGVNDFFSKVGILEKIFYPTGGSMEIQYESNEYHQSGSNLKAGGLRVKKVIQDYGTTTMKETNYYYTKEGEDGNSSGIKLFEPTYSYDYYWENFQEEYVGFVYPCQCTGQSTFPIPSNGGFVSVRYTTVSEQVSTGANTGKTVSFYEGGGGVLAYYGYPFGPAVFYDWALHNPTKVKTFKIDNGSPVLVKEIQNIYKDAVGVATLSLPNEKVATGVKVVMGSPPLSNGQGWTRGPDFLTTFYDYYSSWYYLKERSETLFSDEGEVSVVRKYYYDNPEHGLNTREVIANKSGNGIDSTIIVKKYPLDYSPTLNNAINTMVDNHMLDSPIELLKLQKKGVNYHLIDGLLTVPFNFQGIILPSDYYKIELHQPVKFSDITYPQQSGKYQSLFPINNNNYAIRTSAIAYSNFGKILESKTYNGISVCYLWGYGGQYPIAKIENASYSDVLGVLGQAAITSLEALNVSESTINTHIQTLRNTLTKSQVTTYTYSPLTGMKSMTDPRGQTEYYEYDGFQRLKEVLDFERNVLTDYQYHYKP